MDNAKKSSFVRVMGKKRLRLRKGGVVQHFDSGGTILGGPGTTTQNPSGVIQNINNALGTNAASANLQPGTNQAQLNNAYTGATNALNAQVGLTNTLMPQASNAVENQNKVAAQQEAMTRGEGPNPAANQLAQAAGANVANQAALMAGQRGAAANPALLARQAAMQGANIQQQAAGEAATLGAEQQIAAQNNLADLSNNQISQTQGATTALNSANQNEQGVLQGANSNLNNASVSMQGNINNNNANANKGILGGITSALSSVPIIGGLFDEGGEVKPGVGMEHHGHKKLEFVHKMAKLGLQHFDGGGSVQPSAPPIDPDKAKQVSDSFKGAFGFADGGQIKQNPLLPGIKRIAPINNAGAQYQQAAGVSGPNIENPGLEPLDLGIGHSGDKESSIDQANAGLTGAQNRFQTMVEPGMNMNSDVGNYLNSYRGGNIISGPHKSHVANFLNGGSVKHVPAMVSAGEVYLNPEQVKKVIHDGANPLKIGYKFKGKAKVKGDSIKNDTIPVDLEEGGVIVDRKNVMSADKARSFVHHSLAKKAVKK